MVKSSTAKCRILGVIDQPKELALIRYVIQKSGYQFWEATTMALALQLSHDHQPDLVLLDVSSPSAEKETFSLLIEYLHQQQIPLILVTSETPGKELKKHLNCPTLDYIQRPIDPIGLMLRIKSALRYKGIQFELGLIRQKLEEKSYKLRQGTIFDDSTGLFNYAYLSILVKLEFARGVRYNAPLAFMLVDIPRLRQINEDYGAGAMNHLLRKLGRLIKSTLRLTDTIGRCKQNRLGVLLPETDMAAANLVANRIYHLVKNHGFSLPSPAKTPGVDKGVSSDKRALKLDIRLGLAAYPDKRVANYEELIEQAYKFLSLPEGDGIPPPDLCSDCPTGQVVGPKL